MQKLKKILGLGKKANDQQSPALNHAVACTSVQDAICSGGYKDLPKLHQTAAKEDIEELGPLRKQIPNKKYKASSFKKLVAKYSNKKNRKMGSFEDEKVLSTKNSQEKDGDPWMKLGARPRNKGSIRLVKSQNLFHDYEQEIKHKENYNELLGKIKKIENERNEFEKKIEDLKEINSTLNHQNAEYEMEIINHKSRLIEEKEKTMELCNNYYEFLWMGT
ncbi:uncharacterized protein [Erythrolamprus reginae]|uniref:uncharacterized protein n=1 Tax=Erythrolamprus reginae TaxID=121349 RepID=UPI00396CDB41